LNEGYRPAIWKMYEEILPSFEEMEQQILATEKR
jgi:hypothetical protein